MRRVAAVAVAGVGLLVLMAAAPLWWRSSSPFTHWLAAAAALTLGATTAWLVRRAIHESNVARRALDKFSQRLREGDVGGALRAVRADSGLPSDAA